MHLRGLMVFHLKESISLMIMIINQYFFMSYMQLKKKHEIHLKVNDIQAI